MAISPASPVNRQHPLNRGLVAWWLALPGTTGMRDIANRRVATLTNGATRRSNAGRQSGFGSVKYASASSQYATSDSVALNQFAIAAWVNVSTTASRMTVAGRCNSGLTTCNYYFRINSGNCGMTVGGSYSEVIAPIPTANTWCHVGFMHDGAGLSTWLNGVLQNTAVSLGAPDNPGTATTIGRDGDSGTNYFDGYMDDVRVYSRFLYASEWMSLYTDSLRRYYSSLQRTKSAVVIFLPAGGSTYTASAAVTTGAVTCSASSTFVEPVYAGSATPSIAPVTAAASATFVEQVYSGSAAVSAGPATATASASSTDPIYTGSSAVTVAATTANGSAAFAAEIYSGSSSPSAAPATLSGAGNSTIPVYSGSSALLSGETGCSGYGTSTGPVYTAASALTSGPLVSVGAGTFSLVVPDHSGLAELSCAGSSLVGSGTFAERGFARAPRRVVRNRYVPPPTLHRPRRNSF